MRENLYSNEKGRLVAELQSSGVILHDGSDSRRGGAGPAEGAYIFLNQRPVSVPTGPVANRGTPFEIKPSGNLFYLYREGRPLVETFIIPRPKFYGLSLEDGTPYWKIALLHGNDCLATTVFQTCIHWARDKGCRFCGIEISLRAGLTVAKKGPKELGMVAKDAMELDGVTHVVLTTGTLLSREGEIRHLGNCVKNVKSLTGLPVHVQCEPPQDLSLLDHLKAEGADTIGLHVESYDEKVLELMAPPKAQIGLRAYERAWERAVNIFGPNQVSSFLILGLGETWESVERGVNVMADLGVFPYVLPLRPIPGSQLETLCPPDFSYCVEVYKMTSEIMHKRGLSSQNTIAGCVRCGACSGLRDFELGVPEFVCHPARNRKELEEAFSIRHQVFVVEQRLFESTERDANDESAIHLVAKRGDEVVGTVRLYPDHKEQGCWYGGRLAVKEEFRKNKVGELLVKEAVHLAERLKVKRFLAYIQTQNVGFFEGLGWKRLGEALVYHGRPHQLMEAPIDRRQDYLIK